MDSLEPTRHLSYIEAVTATGIYCTRKREPRVLREQEETTPRAGRVVVEENRPWYILPRVGIKSVVIGVFRLTTGTNFPYAIFPLQTGGSTDRQYVFSLARHGWHFYDRIRCIRLGRRGRRRTEIWVKQERGR